MTGWRLAVVLGAAFGGGYVLRLLVCVFRCTDTMIRLARRLYQAEDHQSCQRVFDKLKELIAWQEHHIDLLERGPAEVVEAAERIAREAEP